MSEWLDLELADRLAPVRAPEGLWYAVQRGAVKAPRRRRVKTAVLVAATAASLCAVAAWRPENRNAPSVVRASSQDMACRSCHSD
jgi:hypothetical protein